MNNVVGIIKINVLALIAFPVLLFATAMKLLAKSMEKAVELFKIVCISFAVIVLFEIMRNLSEAIDFIFLILIFFGMLGIFSFLLFLVITLATVIIQVIISLLIGGCEAVYAGTYAIYAKLFQMCTTEYDSMEEMQSPATKGLCCFVYSLLRIVNKVIIVFTQKALVFMILASIGVIIGGILAINGIAMRDYGISILTYIKLFPTFEIVYGVVLYFTFTLGISSILITLGTEWSEWGTEMQLWQVKG